MVTCPHCVEPDHPAGPCPVCGLADPAVYVGAESATFRLTVPATRQPDTTPAPPGHLFPTPVVRPRLVVVRGEAPGTVYPVLPGRNYLGRAGDKPVDLDLTGQEPVERTWTSRQHACVTLDGGSLVLEDLVSLNGTFVNRARLHPGQSRALQPGDVVQVGTVQLRVEVG